MATKKDSVYEENARKLYNAWKISYKEKQKGNGASILIIKLLLKLIDIGLDIRYELKELRIKKEK